MRDLERLRFVTAHYFELQGLRYVPVGLLLMALGAFRFDDISATSRVFAPFLFLLVTIASSSLVGYAYHGRYGHVRGRGDTEAFGWLTVRSGWLTAPVALIVLASTHVPPFSNAAMPPLAVAALLAAAVCFYSGCSYAARGMHYVPLAVGFAALALGDATGATRGISDAFVCFMIGTAVVVAGIGDHLVLQSAFLARERDGRAPTV